MWYIQKDGLVMGASPVVILANLWMKEFEPVLRKKNPKFCKPIDDLNGICPEFRKKQRIDRNVLNVKIFYIRSIKKVVSFKKWNIEIQLILFDFAWHAVS